MANIASQIKRNRQNERRRMQNKAVRRQLRTYQKHFEVAVASGDRDAAEQALRTAGRRLDKAAQEGVVHSNYAANRKSQMARQLATL